MTRKEKAERQDGGGGDSDVDDCSTALISRASTRKAVEDREIWGQAWRHTRRTKENTPTVTRCSLRRVGRLAYCKYKNGPLLDIRVGRGGLYAHVIAELGIWDAKKMV